MGEYIKINGKTVKLGTCEDLYYTSFQKLVNVVTRAEHVPGNMQPREYFETGWRYRFPFPDEADLQVGDDGPGHRFTRAAVWHARGEKEERLGMLGVIGREPTEAEHRISMEAVEQSKQFRNDRTSSL